MFTGCGVSACGEDRRRDLSTGSTRTSMELGGSMMSKETNNQNTGRTIIRRDILREIRNMIDFSHLFRRLGWPWKRRNDGVILFVCPECSESQTSVNPKTNLARCFRCKLNWNPIDFTMVAGRMEFLEAYDYLEEMLPRPPDPSDLPF